MNHPIVLADAFYQRNLVYQLLCLMASRCGYDYSVQPDNDLPGMDVVALDIHGRQISFHVPHEDVLLPLTTPIAWDFHDRERKFQRIEDQIQEWLTEI